MSKRSFWRFMNKFLTILAISIFVISIASAAEQPLSRIAICEADGGNCRVAGDGEYKEIQACENIMLKNDSRDPLGLPLIEVNWIAKEDGEQKANVFQGNTLNFTWSRDGYVKVVLNVSNGKLFDETFIIMAVRENKIPKIEKIISIIGIDKNETAFESDTHQVLQTALGVNVTIKRKYAERKSRDALKPDTKADTSILISESKCEGSECKDTLNFPKEGIFPITFSDSNLCGKSEPVTIEVKVFRNRPPNKVDISGELAGESSISLSGKDSEASGPNNKIIKYNWSVIDINVKIVKNTESESSGFSFSDKPGKYKVMLCVTDRFKGAACSEPKDVLIFGLETRKADPTATLPDAEIYQNITLNATRSTPLRIIDRFEWRICFLDKGQCRDEKIFRNSLPLMNISVDRSGEYRAKLRIYVGNKTDESSEFHIKVKSASEKIPANITSKETPITTKNITEPNVSEIGTLSKNETQPAIPALGILPALVILCLVWYVNKGGRK